MEPAVQKLYGGTKLYWSSKQSMESVVDAPPIGRGCHMRLHGIIVRNSNNSAVIFPQNIKLLPASLLSARS